MDILFQDMKRLEDSTHDEINEEIPLLQRKCGWFPHGRFGLKGGAPSGPSGSKKNQSSLRLINNRSQATRNICFTNVIVQLLKKSGYASLLKTQFPQFLEGKSPTSYQGCKALNSLYAETNRERSAASLRKLVAQQSGKLFLANGQQQDSEEFLRAVITMMSVELKDWEPFNIVNSEHIGKEKIERKF